MSTPFLLEIIYPTHSKSMDVTSIDITSVAGGFFIGPNSAPLASILGKNTHLTVTLADEKKDIIQVPAGVLTINHQGDVSILIIDPETMYALENLDIE